MTKKRPKQKCRPFSTPNTMPKIKQIAKELGLCVGWICSIPENQCVEYSAI